MTETDDRRLPDRMARRVSTDERIVGGIAVPWNETSYPDARPEGRALPARARSPGPSRRAATGSSCSAAVTEHQHDAAIARPVELDARHPDGLWASWRIAKTPAGDAALAEVAEGLLDAFSVGFRAIRAGRGADGAREIAEAELLEVQLLPARRLRRRARPRGPRAGGSRALDDLDRWLAAHPRPGRRPDAAARAPPLEWTAGVDSRASTPRSPGPPGAAAARLRPDGPPGNAG